MFVITADQVNSRGSDDIVDDTLLDIGREHGARLVLAPDRNAGDEIQILLSDADAAIEIVLKLTRSGRWSVGVGIGTVEYPLPTETRAARGPAFIAARDAVTAAKRTPTRFALRREPSDSPATATQDAESLISAVLALRIRRTRPGWEVYDLLAEGLTQREAAQRLGISEQAVADRVSAANVKIDTDTHGALARLCAALDDPQSHPSQPAEENTP